MRNNSRESRNISPEGNQDGVKNSVTPHTPCRTPDKKAGDDTVRRGSVLRARTRRISRVTTEGLKEESPQEQLTQPDHVDKVNHVDAQRVIQLVAKKFKAQEPISQLDSKWDAVDVGLTRTAFRRLNDKEAYWCPPKALWECFYGMPYSHEIALNNSGRVYFIDHSTQSVSMSHPIEIQVHTQDSKTTLEEKNILVHLNPNSSISNYGLIITKKNASYIVESVSSNSPFNGTLLAEDILLEINDSPLSEIDNISYFFRNRSKVTFKLLRPIVRTNLSNAMKGAKGPKKSNIRSETRRQFLNSHPVSVHFCDRPSILQYIHETILNRWEECSIERNFLNVLKINFSGGMVKSFRFRRTQTVAEMVSEALHKLNLPMEHCFTLALVPSGSADVQYFSHEQLVSTVLTQKNEKPDHECHMLLYTFPQSLSEWSDKKYRSLINYLFHQTRNFLLRANIAWLSNISSNDLHQLIAMSATIDFLLSGLNQIETVMMGGADLYYPMHKLSVGSNDTLHSSSSTSKTYRSAPSFSDKSVKKIRLSTYKLEQWSIFPPWATLKEIRRDLDQYHIITLMINCFDQIATNDMKIFFFADPHTHSNFNIKLDHVFHEKVDGIIAKAQMIFIQASMETRVIDCIRYRVHFCICNHQPTSRKVRSIGIPGTIVLSHQKIEVEGHDEITEVMKVKDITGIIASYKDENRYIITIVSAEIPNMLSFITPACDFRAIFWILSAYAVDIANTDNIRRKVSIIDVTNKEFRCEAHTLPKYKDLHLVLPSLWNYSSPPGLFFRKYLESADSKTLSPFDSIKNLLPWLMLFPSECKDPNVGYFGLETLTLCHHFTVAASITSRHSRSSSLCSLPEIDDDISTCTAESNTNDNKKDASHRRTDDDFDEEEEEDASTSTGFSVKGLMADEIEMIKNSDSQLSHRVNSRSTRSSRNKLDKPTTTTTSVNTAASGED